MEIDQELYNMSSTIKNAEVVKALVINRLYSEKVISEEIAIKYREEYGVIVIKESWYKTIFSENKWIYKFIKLKD